MNVTSKGPETPALGTLRQIRRFGVPAAIAGLAAVVEIGGDRLRLGLRYQRDLVADGEFWRLLTGHLVHLGPSHMAMNVAALGVLVVILGRILKPVDWLGIFLLSALAIDAGLFWFSRDISWYVGLSGVLHGYWAAASIRAWVADRNLAAVLSGLILVKLGYEAWFGPLSVTGEVAAGPVVTVAHAYGALGGAVWALSTFAIRQLERPL